MKKAKELKQERASLIQEQSTLTAGAVDRSLTDDENTQFDDLQSRIENLDKAIERAEKFEANQARVATQKGEKMNADKKEVKEEARFSLLRALRNLAEGKPLETAEAQVHDEALAELRAQGLPLPKGNSISLPLEARAQTVTEDSGTKGGALVASTPQFVRPLQPILPIASLGVNVMSGLVGDVPLPTSGSFTFSYLGENDTASASDVTFSGPTLKPKRCTGIVDISNQLLLQSSFNVEAYIIEQINIAYGNAVTLAAINGGGGDEPTGLYSLITTNIDTTATNLTHDIAVNLESLVDAADGTNVARAYLSDTKVRSKAKTTKIDAGSGIFLSNGMELNGYQWNATTLMPTLDVGVSHPLIFGDWNQLHVGYWGNISIKVDPYTQAAKGNVRLIIEGYSDVQVANEKAFAINKVLTVS